MKRSTPIALALLLLACTKKTPPPPFVELDAAPIASLDARAIAEKSCGSCHTMEMLAQQRLTDAQWTKTVTKMVSWGANLEASETPALIAWLSAEYGPDAGPYPTPELEETKAAAAEGALLDGPFAGGGAERGHALYTDRCSGCHGPEARGHIGVNLVDRPFLYRAGDVAQTIRKGRGKMPPAKIADPEVADILAYLRALR